MDKFEKPNRIDDLEQKLYSPNQSFTQKERKHLQPKEYSVAQDWPTEHLDAKGTDLIDEEKKPNLFFRFFILAIIFFVGAAGYLGVNWYLNSGINASNVDILVNSPLSIGAGETLDFEISIQNKNQVSMRYVDIEVVFPDGTRSAVDLSKELKNTNEKVDALQIGEIIKRNYSALLFGEEGDKKEISILLTYQVDESSQLFKKEKKFDVVLSSTPVRLTITNVKEITSGQEIIFTVELASNSSQTLKNVMVQATYPFGFTYRGATLAPKSDKKTWIVPTLAPKEVATFTIRGFIDGQNKDDKFFTFKVGLEDEKTEGMQVVFTSKDTIIALVRPFLETFFAVDGDSSEIIVLDPEINKNAEISFKNNTESQLRNTSIQLVFNTSTLLKDAITANEGFYQSTEDKIVWDNTTSERLITLPAGASDRVNFSFRGLGILSDTIIVNPETSFTINVKSNRNPENQVAQLIENSIVKKIRFNTEVALKAESLYYSALLPNTGPLPPKVEQKTTYTGLISLKNTSNIVSGGVVSMRIPNYVQYEGVFSPSTENVSYDSVTRILSWNIGTIATKTGYAGSKPKELAFKVSIIPSISQAGTSPVLVENITFKGVDSYTGTEISKSVEPITTGISDSEEFYISQVSR
jgi:hypothetical protein